MLNLTELLKYAAREKASDVHITVGISPKIRVHGKLISTSFPKMTASDTLEVLLGIVNPEQREYFDQTGELDLSVSIPSVGRYRVNAYKQRGSITLAFRLVDMDIPGNKELEIPKCILELCNEKRGLILVTGPAGSGKSTMLAALVDYVNEHREANIITLEDPIEYLHQHKMSMVNQREIGLDTESYEVALHSAMREDPDVLQVSNITDCAVMNEIMKAAETGRLVFASMYMVGTTEALEALVESFPVHQQKQARIRLANVLKAVVSRQLCVTSDEAERIPAYEILLANHEIRELIEAGEFSKIKEVMSTNKASGMILMDDCLTELYQKGKISRNTAILQSKNQEAMARRLSGDSATNP